MTLRRITHPAGWLIFLITVLVNSVSVKAKNLEPADQLQNVKDPALGQVVAERLNNRFYSTEDTCGDRAAFYCNGILLRATDASTAFHAWDPSPTSVRTGAVSFSFFRNDLQSTRLQSSRTQGFILLPSEDMSAKYYPVSVSCSFAYDAATSNRNEAGCGTNNTQPSGSQMCADQGIDTVDAWIAHFMSVEMDNGYRYMHQCGFKPDATGFALSLAGRRESNPQSQRPSWSQNEVVIATWPQGIPEQLPIEAFFYSISATRAIVGLDAARFFQEDFFRETGRFVPVVQMNYGAAASQKIFSYHEADQVVPVPAADAAPSVPAATGEDGTLLKQADYYTLNNLDVVVPAYGGMKAGQRVWVSGETRGRTFRTAVQTVTEAGPLTFTLPRPEVMDAIGGQMSLHFSVQNAGESAVVRSGALNLSVEGQALTLPAAEVSADGKTVTARFSGMATSHKISVRWTGATEYTTPLATGNAAGEVTFTIPDQYVAASAGRRVAINYAVGTTTGAQYQFSRVTWITVPGGAGGDSAVSRVHPAAPQATGDNGTLLKQVDYYRLTTLDLTIPEYEGTAPGQLVQLVWTGPGHGWESPVQEVAEAGTLHFALPREEYLDAIGGEATVRFTVQTPGSGDIAESAPLTLKVEGQTLALPAPAVSADGKTVTVAFSGMTANHRISLRVGGVSEYLSGLSAGNAAGQIILTVPDAVLAANAGRVIAINYAVGSTSGAQYQFSRGSWVTVSPYRY